MIVTNPGSVLLSKTLRYGVLGASRGKTHATFIMKPVQKFLSGHAFNLLALSALPVAHDYGWAQATRRRTLPIIATRSHRRMSSRVSWGGGGRSQGGRGDRGSGQLSCPKCGSPLSSGGSVLCELRVRRTYVHASEPLS